MALKICLDDREGLLDWVVIGEVGREENKFTDCWWLVHKVQCIDDV